MSDRAIREPAAGRCWSRAAALFRAALLLVVLILPFGRPGHADDDSRTCAVRCERVPESAQSAR